MRKSSIIGRLVPGVRILVAGSLAGAVALAIDLQLVSWTTGYPLRVGARYLLAYSATGLLAATLVAIALRLRGSPSQDRRLFALSLALLYAIPVAERAQHAAVGISVLIAGVAVVLAPIGYLAWIALLTRIGHSATVAAVLASLAAASALAINRSLIDRAISPAAFGVNLGLVAGSSVLAVLIGRRLTRHWLTERIGVAGLVVAGASGVLLPSIPAVGIGVPGGEPRMAQARPPLPPRETGSAPSSADRASTTATLTEQGANFVLIVVDTLRADVFWNVLDNTEEGRAFRDRMSPAARMHGAVAVSPWTVPSMGSLLTGLYPEEHGFTAPEGLSQSGPLQTLHPSVETMAETLGRLGYRTEALVTNPLLHPVSGIARGFEHYALLPGPTVKLPLATALARIGLLPREYYQGASAVRRQLRSALDRIEEDTRPFFLWLHLMDPHDPLTPHRRLPAETGESELPELDLLYRREVRYCLGELARTLDDLESHDLLADTTIVFISDHGEMFPSDRHRGGTPRRYGHGHALYDELVRIPLLIRQPRWIESDLTSESLISHVDLHGSLPELLEIRPLPNPNPERQRIVELLRSEEDRDRGSVTRHSGTRRFALSGSIRHGPQQRSVRTARYKLIESLEGAREIELYDLSSDSRERHNLGPERPQLVRALQEMLRNAVAEHQAPPDDIEPADRKLLEQLKTLGYVQ